METKEIKAPGSGKSLYFCSTDGQRYVGVNKLPHGRSDEQQIADLIDGKAGQITPVTFNRGFIEALENDEPQVQQVKTWLSEAVAS